MSLRIVTETELVKQTVSKTYCICEVCKAEVPGSIPAKGWVSLFGMTIDTATISGQCFIPKLQHFCSAKCLTKYIKEQANK